jgi:hypothetical protein
LATGAPVLPAIEGAGTASTGLVANGAANLPAITASGVAAITRRATGAPVLPAITASGVADGGGAPDEVIGGAPHGAYIAPFREVEPETLYDDIELALLAVSVIGELDD